MEVCLNIEEAMRAYNQFHHAFPDYKNNDICAPEDIMLRNKLERFLVASGK
jgi:hypothetical protein